MRFLTQLMVTVAAVGFLTACGSAPKQEQQERQPASVQEPACQLVKHPKQNWWRLKVNGDVPYKSWYTKKQAVGHKAKFSKLGKCQ